MSEVVLSLSIDGTFVVLHHGIPFFRQLDEGDLAQFGHAEFSHADDDHPVFLAQPEVFFGEFHGPVLRRLLRSSIG